MVIFIFLSSEIPFLCLFDPKIQRVSLRRNLVARLISVFRFLIGNNLISSNQSGFKPGDSWINQFLSIAHEIYKPFDDEFKVRVVFLNISKAFDIVWRKGVIFKLKQNGISGKLPSVTAESYLKGQVSSWTGVNTRVQQGSILGLLLFLVYINDLAKCKIACRWYIFIFGNPRCWHFCKWNYDLYQINKWASKWKMRFCPAPNKQVQVRVVFLDISKAFDIVWRKGVIFKLKQNGISGKLPSVTAESYLKGQVSSWTGVNTRVQQGSILGLLLFLVYINDLAKCKIACRWYIFIFGNPRCWHFCKWNKLWFISNQ